MLGDDFKAFSQVGGKKEWKALYDGNFNTLRTVMGGDSLPDIPRKNQSVATDKYVTPKPKGAFEHDREFRPGGTCLIKKDQL